jgi:ketosteroid isomerase-like protein
MMKSPWMLALLIPLMLFGSSVRADDLRAEMEAANKQWLEAFNTPSIASFPAMYTEDAVLIPGGMAPAVPGPEAITKFWEGSIRAGLKDHTLEIVETRADGNLAYVLSTWTVKQVKSGNYPNNSEESTLQGHTLRVLLKQSDGTWKTKVHLFVPLASPVPQEAKK